MLSFIPAFPSRRAPRLLCIGAHSDDLEIGCGGTVLEMGKRFPAAHVEWVVLSGDGVRAEEARQSARALLARFDRADVVVGQFRDGYFPDVYRELKDYFESRKRAPRPDLIFTHALHDRHQDHRLVSQLTWNTWRDTTILEFEVPKYEGDLGSPNFYVPLGRGTARKKLGHLMKYFPSQRARRWFDERLFESHLRMRGIECNAPSGMAESFHGRKVCL